MKIRPADPHDKAVSCPMCKMPKNGQSCVNPQCSAYTGSGWAAASPGAANDYYQGSRLAYGPVDDTLAGIVTPQMVSAFFRTAFLMWLGCLVLIALLVVFIVFSSDSGWEEGAPLGGILFLLSFVVFFISYRLPMSGWHFLLDDKAAAADSAFAQVFTALNRRESPINEVKPRRIAGGPDRGTRNYLQLKQGQFSAYVSVFPYGRDLFVGWTLWWELRPLSMLWTFAFAQRGLTYFELVVRSDEAQAFREVVHNATREGIDVASLGILVPIATAFGSEIPIDTQTSAW